MNDNTCTLEDAHQHDGSPGWVVPGCPFLHSLIHFFVPVLPSDRNISGLKIFEIAEWPHPSNRGPVYLLEVVSIGSTFPFSWHFG